MSISFTKFEKRLALAAYFRHVFGVTDPESRSAIQRYYEAMAEVREGYDEEGQSYLVGALRGRKGVRIDGNDLRRYDQNVRRHLDKINARREAPITFRYFQTLAALMTERYLYRVTNDPEGLLRDINAYAEQQNKHRTYIKYPTFEEEDLTKVALWMATGSGKTLLMHLNYYQYLHYQDEPVDHILLVTPNEGLSEQHLAAMHRSGIEGYHFLDMPSGLLATGRNAIKVIEITKLIEEKTGEGDRVEVSAFEGNNLVFVDEGHKGSGSEAGAWRSYRAQLAESGFTFEYSATFGQAVGGTTSAAVEEEYGKAILFDYSYRHFHRDGYGKDYRILNLDSELDAQIRRRYLLANLLTFYEQLQVFEGEERELTRTYNLEAPLLLFMGHSVTSGKTRSTLSKNDKRSISDVQELVGLLRDVLTGQDWVPDAIDRILSGTAGLKHEDGKDLFAGSFKEIRAAGMDGKAIYRDMLQRLFHVSAPSTLHLVDLKDSKGEIGLRAGAADSFFGVINIGDDTNFLKMTEKKMEDLTIEESAFEGSLFKDINRPGSQVNILIGSKKFIEGWSSWRVSTMGLMNIGRGEGPQIIQLFGRGVRLLGKNRTLKRSAALPEEGPHPDWLPLLETLSIFGVRAKYMEQFRDYLEAEGIDVDERVAVELKTRVQDEFLNKSLFTIRPQQTISFEDSVRLYLELDDQILPQIDLTPHVDVMASREIVEETPGSYDAETSHTLDKALLPLLDWHRIYRDVWQFRSRRGYTNLTFDRETLRSIIESEQYRLICREELLKPRSYDDLRRLEEFVLMALRKYVAAFYDRHKRAWEQKHMAYHELTEDDDNVVQTVQARVKRSAGDVLDELTDMLDSTELYEGEDGLPPRVYFDRHLYLPLLKKDSTDIIHYSPPGINAGEWRFVEQLRDFAVSSKGEAFLEGRELYLLRNQARGQGVGFTTSGKRYFPDFILWVKMEDHQHIAFVDPKGLVHSGNLDDDYKVQLHRQIKEHEQELNQKADRSDISLHAFIISETSYADLREQAGLSTKEAFHNRGIYFAEDDDHIQLILKAMTEEASVVAGR